MISYSHTPNSGIIYRVEYLKTSIGTWYFDRQYRKIDEAKKRLSQLKSEFGSSYKYRIIKCTKVVEVVEEE
jgi:hypothetical protein